MVATLMLTGRVGLVGVSEEEHVSEGQETGPSDPTVPEKAPGEHQPGWPPGEAPGWSPVGEPGPGGGSPWPPPSGYGTPPSGYDATPPGYGAPPPGYGAPPPGYGAPPGQPGPPPGYGPPGSTGPGPSYGTGASSAGGAWPAGLPPLPSSERIRLAWEGRAETDYIFNYWSALGWTIVTLGIYGFYVFYQLVRRMRDHNARRLELLDAALNLGWDEAGRRGLQGELTPSFQRAAAHLAVLRRMTSDFREPVIWLVLSIIASGIVHIIAFIFLDQDLVKHDRAEVGIEYELALIYGRFGYPQPFPDTNRVKGPHNYVGRVVATIFSFGIYSFWWWYDMMIEPNYHFYINWSQEDALAAAVQAMI